MKILKITNRIKCIFLLFILFLLCMFSCYQASNVYIISKEDSLKRIEFKESGKTLAPPKYKYGQYTFIVDSSYNIYFYSFPEENFVKGVNDDEESDCIGLTPNIIFNIPKGLEKAIFDNNVLNQKSANLTKSVILSSFRDTIRTDFINYLKQLSEQKKIILVVRPVLPEERDVLFFKNAGKFYAQNNNANQ